MEVGSIAGVAMAALKLLRIGSAADHAGMAVEPPVLEHASDELSIAASDAFRDVLAKYDVRNISPRELTEMLQELREAGGIGDAELNQLAQIRLDLDVARVDPDQPLDLLERYEEKLAEQSRDLEKLLQRRAPDAAQLATAQQRVERSETLVTWLRRFATLHHSRGIDAAA